MADSYYRTIKGKQYDRELLEIVEKASKRSKAPLNKNIAKSLFVAIVDGGDYTDIEKRTLKYIRDNFNFASDADEYLRTEIRKWAAKNSATPAKKSSKSNSKSPKKAKSSSLTKIESEENSDSFFHVYDTAEEEEIEPTPEYNELVELNRYGKKPEKSLYLRYVFIGIFIILVICLFFIVRSCRSGSSDVTKKDNVNNKNKVESSTNSVKENNRELLLPHTEIGTGNVKIKFERRSEAIRYINDLSIGFVKQTLNTQPGSSDQIATLAEALKKYPQIRTRIKGHTCFIGELDENKILSEERAKLIRDELIKLGVNSSQLDVRGFGETTSIDTNYTEQGRIKNRRVDFSVLSVQDNSSSGKP
ncbi:MAG: OmpA family protein [Leptospira sp.]|nr:OmpA family protein [Leptospira sp.]